MNNAILIVNHTPAETLGHIARLNGQIVVDGDRLIIKGIANIPDTLKTAIRAHKPVIHRLVAAYGGCWPTSHKIQSNNIT